MSAFCSLWRTSTAGPHLPAAPGPGFAVPSQLDAHRERGLSGTVCSALCAFGIVCAGMAYRKVRRGARGATQGHVVATSPAQDLAGTDAAFQQGAAHEAKGEIQEARQCFQQSMQAGYPRARNRLINIDMLLLDPALPGKLEALWVSAAQHYDSFEAQFLRTGHVSEGSWQHLEAAATELTELAKFNLGDWRMYQLYGRLLDVYTVLSRDTKHVALAAQWAVQRAVHPLGQNAYATEESSEKDDFNQAITAAMLYYRRIGDQERLQNAMEFANKHPYASTHYQNSWQTPRTFHPGYRGQPWWEGDSFQLVQRLEKAWEDPDTRAKITEELDTLLSKGAFERVFSPSALVVPGSVNEDRNGAEWSEYLLYDPKSVKLDETKCAGIPTLSSLLRDPSNKDAVHPEINKSTVVSILSLDPGARIMPHCGVTNRQLVMHFALKGSDGVEFTVAGETRGYGGDGHAIVFDDSFEHSVYHAGKERRYILFAMLRHPDSPADA
ncbi:ASPH [Symbiodinium sp. KB8]|nr:ASPH [Symbiodinium sp. KB8]